MEAALREHGFIAAVQYTINDFDQLTGVEMFSVNCPVPAVVTSSMVPSSFATTFLT